MEILAKSKFCQNRNLVKIKSLIKTNIQIFVENRCSKTKLKVKILGQMTKFLAKFTIEEKKFCFENGRNSCQKYFTQNFDLSPKFWIFPKFLFFFWPKISILIHTVNVIRRKQKKINFCQLNCIFSKIRKNIVRNRVRNFDLIFSINKRFPP